MEDNINNDDLSLEDLKKLLNGDLSFILSEEDIKKSIDNSENLIQRNIDEMMDKFKDFKTEIHFINKSNNPDPTYSHKGDSGLDLRVNFEDGGKVTLKSFERMLIPTGLHFGIPEGFDMEIKSRSGLAVKHGITVLTGTIDQNYIGEIKVLLFNSGKEDFIINHGDRIAQAVIRPVTNDFSVRLKKTTQLEKSTRMENGFGSSGIN
jgi:dUTP pyrophosphatase